MLLFATIIVSLGVSQADDPLRPQYHMMPPKNWLNDPNGPVYYNGYYHMFFQHNPNAAVWGDMHWGHCYSEDMVHWIHLPVAIAPDQPYDKNGIFTGSTTLVDGIPVIIYTGITETNEQVQCQARPANLSDPTLTSWIKSPLNPIITHPNGRDPATAFEDDYNNYYLIYGFGTDELGGQAVLFTSKDFSNWTYLHPIHSNHYDNFWECPDIFNVSNRIVLKASLRGQDFWAIGDFDPTNLIFVPVGNDLGEYTQLIDQGKFYASKSFYDPLNDQQVIMGWTAEDDNQGEQRGWQGLHTLPRAIFLSDDGLQLRTRPIEALQSLRNEKTHRHFQNVILPTVIPFVLVPDVSGNQIEIIINWQFSMNQVDRLLSLTFISLFLLTEFRFWHECSFNIRW
nr:putative GH32 family protein [Didymodactylos carnosus]WEI57600.1 putative GH32 family protein [Didymodactylos carnosus]WEI57601.1 putative GH32 family protein [Didymodactylos carnosus]WEI57602.1 putative GH32 family protein [Didymodactylos carnosus]